MGRIPFNQQIRNFENTLDQITGNLGATTVAPVVAQCIFFVGMGSNDYLNNYLMPNYPTRSQYNSRQFADLLTQQYTQQLTVSLRYTFTSQILVSLFSINLTRSLFIFQNLLNNNNNFSARNYVYYTNKSSKFIMKSLR